MSIALSRPVFSSQQGVHENLPKVVERHRDAIYQKPIPVWERQLFCELDQWVRGYSKVVLDNGCGSGESTAVLARENPDCACVGVDKSQHRVAKQDMLSLPSNARVLRADLEHFLRLVYASNWNVLAQYFLYPNPWPKSAHLKRRWHAHPLFPIILQIGGRIELRTNWQIYAQEFCAAIEQMTGQVVMPNEFKPVDALSRFESKYHLSGHCLFQVVMPLSQATVQSAPQL